MNCTHKKNDKYLSSGADESMNSVSSSHKPASKFMLLGLHHEPYSLDAQSFVENFALKIHSGKVRAKPGAIFLTALGAVLADLIMIAGYGAGAYAFRSMRVKDFTGEHVGHHATSKALANLQTAGMITRRWGAKAASYKATRGDRASQFFVQQPLLDAAAAYGITPGNWAFHFRLRPRPAFVKDSIRLRKSRLGNWFEKPDRGETMAVDWNHPHVIAAKQKVDEINGFLFTKDITVLKTGNKFRSGCHRVYRRLYAQGELVGYNYDKGGRLYSEGGGYQSLPRIERATIEIDGHKTIELDIRGSFIVILHAMNRCPLDPEIDPYEGISADRNIAKLFVVQTLGSDKLPTRWSPATAKDYAEANEGACLYCDHPFKLIKAAVLEKFPLLKGWATLPMKWGDLQFEESEVVINVVHTLAIKNGIPALPVHDSIIIPVKDEALARRVMKETFEYRFGVEPFIK